VASQLTDIRRRDIAGPDGARPATEEWAMSVNPTR
jgi:hypothetical protein